MGFECTGPIPINGIDKSDADVIELDGSETIDAKDMIPDDLIKFNEFSERLRSRIDGLFPVQKPELESGVIAGYRNLLEEVMSYWRR